MIVDEVFSRTAYAGFSDAWEDWCSKKFAGSPELIAKCNSKPMGFLTLAPWTDVGALQRGIPKGGLVDAATGLLTGGGGAAAGSVPPAQDAGIFGLPPQVMWLGLGVFAIGVGGLALKKSRRKR